jgi:hypothetical protein
LAVAGGVMGKWLFAAAVGKLRRQRVVCVDHLESAGRVPRRQVERGGAAERAREQCYIIIIMTAMGILRPCWIGL